MNSNSANFFVGFFPTVKAHKMWLLVLLMIAFSLEDYRMVTGLSVVLCVCSSSAGY